MAIELNQRISEGLSMYLEKFTSEEERSELKFEFKLSQSTIYKVVTKREISVTEKTLPYLERLLQLAIKNRTKMMPILNKVHRDLAQKVN